MNQTLDQLDEQTLSMLYLMNARHVVKEGKNYEIGHIKKVFLEYQLCL